MHVADGADALNGGDFRVVPHLAHLHDAGTGHLAVQNDVAGAAMALAAANLAAGEQQMLTQNLGQGFVLLQHQVAGDAVNYQSFSNHSLTSC